ncbi:MAG: ketoacyl-ACP synthase III [Myxococcales bacterium]|nr:MAG: ketoacyl-ACP synthase III [Myxococcales bacterium]
MTISSAILGVGHHVPDRIVSNDDLAKIMSTSDDWIRKRTGIAERRFIDPQSSCGASDLAVPAVTMACKRAGIAPSELDAIVFATLSPDYNFPGSGCLLQRKLGLSTVPALDIRNQCSGFLYGLQIADAWVRCGMYKHVCLVGAEVHSTGLDFSDKGRDVAVLFGDGAGAVIVGPAIRPQQGIIDIELHADGSGAKELWVEAPTSAHFPRIDHAMIDEGKQFPRMNGKQVFRWATEKMPEVSLSILKKNKIPLDDVDLFVPHQANMRINELVAKKLGINPDKVVHNIEKYGNTTAASIPMALSSAWEEEKALPGQLVLFAAFGSGFTWGSALVRL